MNDLSQITGPNDCRSRRYSHVFDQQVFPNCKDDTHPVDKSPDAIGGAYGIGWYEYFRCHRTGHIYVVHCSDGVNGGKTHLSERDYRWVQEAQTYIIQRTQLVRRGDIKLSWREWRLMQGRTFSGWLDAKPGGESYQTVGDEHRNKTEGEIGTINGRKVIVDPDYRDNLPKIGTFQFGDLGVLGIPQQAPRADSRHTNTFGGVFADAFAKAGLT